ncbi:hypothetical protein PYV61_23735 [Roseisolibacter sp. H3M3-2]|nr:hypothetical protein [Roseisolibacter sp. H3M3-2]
MRCTMMHPSLFAAAATLAAAAPGHLVAPLLDPDETPVPTPERAPDADDAPPAGRGPHR